MGKVTEYNAMVRAAQARGESLTVPEAVSRWKSAGVGFGGAAGVIGPGGPEPAISFADDFYTVEPGDPLGAGRGAGAGIIGPLAAGATALGVTLPPALLAFLGIAAAGYAGYQALGGGEGGGLFGLNLLGGDESMIPGTQIGLGGPGLPEPGPGTGWLLLKEWHVNYDWGRLQYYLIQKMGSVGRHTNRWIALYNTLTKEWKAWRWVPPKLAVIGKNMPRHQMLVRLRRNLKRHTADARTLLKFVSPNALAKPKRHYYRRRR